MAGLLNFAIESDPFALLTLLAAFAAGVGAYYLFSWWRMEDGLRARRSPNQVRMEAASVAVVFAAAFPCLLATWGFGYFLIFLAFGFLLALWGRSSLVGWAFFTLGVMLAVVALALGLTPSGHSVRGGAALPAMEPAQTHH